jgi:enamine deaminase RidA (YjgF/YER057c/UK114 family)
MAVAPCGRIRIDSKPGRAMNTRHNPTAVAPPFGAYSHAIEVPPGARWLYVSGQVGVRPDGTMGEGTAGQVEWAFRNVVAVLEAAGMGPGDLVRLNQYLIRREDAPLLRQVRAQVIGDVRPASTLIVVAGLAAPDWLVEVEAVAAKA